MELNNIAFLYLFVLRNKTPSYITINFFLIQNISSLSIIIYILIKHKFSNELIFRSVRIILLVGLIIKISLPPFHSWIIKLSKNTTWNMNILFITWQKLIPIFIIMKFQNFVFIIISIIFLLTGNILITTFTKIKPLIISSSVVHIGWLFAPQSTYKIFPLFYLFIYTLIIYPLINIFKIKNEWKLIKTSQKNNFIIALNVFNLGGVPPLTGFILKWIVFSILAMQNINILIIIIMFIIATVSFYIYFQITYNMLVKNNKVKKMKTESPKPDNSIILIIAIIMPLFAII